MLSYLTKCKINFQTPALNWNPTNTHTNTATHTEIWQSQKLIAITPYEFLVFKKEQNQQYCCLRKGSASFGEMDFDKKFKNLSYGY